MGQPPVKPAVTVSQPTLMPTNKVIGYTTGAIIASMLLAIIRDYTGLSFADDPMVVQGLPIVIGGLVGYFVQDLPNT